MDWEFDRALDGNVAVIGELDLSASRTFTLGLAFGDGLHAATTVLLQSLGLPYEEQRSRFLDQWRRASASIASLQASFWPSVEKWEGTNFRVEVDSWSTIFSL